jgi:hypothetical protein
MYLFLLSQEVNKSPQGVKACLVVAQDDEFARHTHPDPAMTWMPYENCWGKTMFDHTMPCEDTIWVHPHNVQVEFMGEASDHLSPGVIMATRT